MNYYCLFYASGFSIFRITGEKAEKLSSENMVTTDRNQDYPSEAGDYIDKRGAGFLFQYINENTITLVVNEIDSIKHDIAGTPIKCAFQVIVDASNEKDVADVKKLAAKIKNDLGLFNKFYSDLFSMRGGLHIEGSKLMDYIDEAKQCDVEPIEPKPFEEPKPSNPSVPLPDESDPTSIKKKCLIIAAILAVVVVLFLLVLNIFSTCSKGS